jgi:hypothetical protein
LCVCVQGDETDFVLLGTGYAFEDEEEPKKGRILVFTVSHRFLRGYFGEGNW